MLESQDSLDVQFVFTDTTILGDFVDKNRNLWDWRSHLIEQSQFKRFLNPLESRSPIGFDLAILNLFGARDYLS
jgi:hypothetical protein